MHHLGQLLLTGVPGPELDPDTARRFKKLQPGGFILFGRNIQSPEQLRKLIDDLRDLSEIELIRIGGTKYQESFWDHEGFALRQPVVASHGQARDLTDIATELGLTRWQVGKLLTEAKAEGIVRIEITPRANRKTSAIDERRKDIKSGCTDDAFWRNRKLRVNVGDGPVPPTRQ